MHLADTTTIVAVACVAGIVVSIVIVGAVLFVGKSRAGGLAAQKTASFENPMYDATPGKANAQWQQDAEPQDGAAPTGASATSGYADVPSGVAGAGYMDISPNAGQGHQMQSPGDGNAYAEIGGFGHGEDDGEDV